MVSTPKARNAAVQILIAPSEFARQMFGDKEGPTEQYSFATEPRIQERPEEFTARFAAIHC